MTKMASSLRHCTRENQINKIIKDQKFSKRREYFLFVSLWDKVCGDLKIRSTLSTPPIVLLFGASPKLLLW